MHCCHRDAASLKLLEVHHACRSDHTLMRLVANYPWQSPPEQRCAYLAQQLGLAGPADAQRTYAVGQLMPGMHESGSLMCVACCVLQSSCVDAACHWADLCRAALQTCTALVCRHTD
jgi:hypothetical protein